MTAQFRVGQIACELFVEPVVRTCFGDRVYIAGPRPEGETIEEERGGLSWG